MSALDEFMAGYAECAAWADLQLPDSEESGSDGYGLKDFAPSAIERVRKDCERFLSVNRADLDTYCEYIDVVDNGSPMEYAGHDFWLTRQGHGAGFWDRGLGNIGTKLADAARQYGETYFYLSSDGLIYSE